MQKSQLPGVGGRLPFSAILAGGMLAGGVPAAAALCGYFALSGIAGVLLQGRLQGVIRGHARATITSAAGLLQEVFSLAAYLGVGLAAQWLGWRLAGGLGAGIRRRSHVAACPP